MVGRYAAVLGVLWICGQAEGQFEVKTLAFSGRQVPGAAAGVNFVAGFGVPAVNSSGEVVFTGILTGPGIAFDNDWGVYAGGPGTVSQSAREGAVAPSSGGAAFFSPFANAAIGASGTVLFSSNLTGPGVTTGNDGGIYAEDAGVVSRVVREGDAAPGAGAGVVFGILDTFAVAGDDWVALECLLAGTGVSGVNDGAVYAGPAGSLTLVAREGDPAPGIAGASYVNVGTARINASGGVAFQGLLTGGSVTPANDLVVFSGTPGLVTPAIREGDPIPGLTPGTTLFGMLSLAIDSAGRVIQRVTLAGPDVNSANDSAILATAGGVPSVIVREGDPAPGAGAGVTLSMNTPYVDLSGNMVFFVTLQGVGVTPSNDTALYTGAASPLTLIAREGDPVPGLGGAVFGSFTNVVPRVNASGDAAFVANLTGAGVNSGNDTALVLWRSGVLSVVAREGDAFDVDDTAGVDLRTVGTITTALSNSAGALRSSLSDSGAVAFSILFGDFSMGVFLASPAAAPCVADTNGDGMLSPADFSAWIAAFNAMTPACDQNGDGSCTPADFSAWIANYNAGCP